MGLLAFFRTKPSSAQVAKERLRIIVSQERSKRGGGPDYLPLLRKEILEVIRKYVNVSPDAIQVNVEREDGHEVLELSVALPEGAQPPPA
jgi:cell division topological specificity factor